MWFGYTSWLHTPHRHLVVDVTVASARKSNNVPRQLVSHSQAALHWELSMANLMRTSALVLLLGTPSVQSIHDYYPFAMEDGGRLAPMAAELIDRMVVLVAVRRFLGMGDADSRSLCSDCYVRMQHFVRRTTSFPFRRFLADVRREFMQRLFAASSWYSGFLSPRRFAEGQC
jgi:hypothetical protein